MNPADRFSLSGSAEKLVTFNCFCLETICSNFGSVVIDSDL
jgi:hypothetical protein